ncbi:MAG TPA: hypothetical protein VFE76_11240, partial [Myxococcales bacterium]|nr:hypothetical protein [Myxococcales bacterium]
AGKPVPLPAQALDHGTGYLLAAAVCRSLTRALQKARRPRRARRDSWWTPANRKWRAMRNCASLTSSPG